MPASPHFPKLPTDWNESTELLRPSQLSVRFFEKATGPKKNILFIVHGFGEQSDRYEHFPFYLQSEVDAIVLPDLPGHGLSYGQRGHCKNIDEFFQALDLSWRLATQRYGSEQTRWTWFGHSFGALLSLAYLTRKADLPLRQVILSAPFLQLSMPVPPLKKKLSQLITPFLGSLSLSNEISGDMISSLPEVGEEYLRNPLNHSKITPYMFSEMTTLMDRVQKMTVAFPYSVQFVLPQSDRLVSWHASSRFAQSLAVKPGAKKSIENWPEGNHELFNDVDRERFFNALSEWMPAS